MKKPQIFVIQSFSKVSEGVYDLIASAAAKANSSVYRADSISAGANIVESIHRAIQEAPLLIADITDASPNVMYEVGLAQAQKKPLILIASSSRAIPFDLGDKGGRWFQNDLTISFKENNLFVCQDSQDLMHPGPYIMLWAGGLME